jgi:hypothetical protein
MKYKDSTYLNMQELKKSRPYDPMLNETIQQWHSNNQKRKSNKGLTNGKNIIKNNDHSKSINIKVKMIGGPLSTKLGLGQAWWLTSVILASWNSEIRRIKVQGQSGQKVSKIKLAQEKLGLLKHTCHLTR